MWLINEINRLMSRETSGLGSIAFLLVTGAFWLWMFIDAIRRGEHMWAFWIFVFPFSVLLYFFLVYRAQASSQVRGFELPGAQRRQRIRELEAQIHHLDKAHLHSQLGDVYFQQGKLTKAETSYRNALDRDKEDAETRSHLGQCLMRLGRSAEALPLLESVYSQDAKHEYGYTSMALAECLTALGRADEALEVWRWVNHEHSYARARVQWAELLISKSRGAEAKPILDEVIVEEAHAPVFQQKRERVWVRRARALRLRL